MKLNELNELEQNDVKKLWEEFPWKEDLDNDIDKFLNTRISRCEHCGNFHYNDELSMTDYLEEGKIINVCYECEPDIRRENYRYFENQQEYPVDEIMEERWIEEGR